MRHAAPTVVALKPPKVCKLPLLVLTNCPNLLNRYLPNMAQFLDGPLASCVIIAQFHAFFIVQSVVIIHCFSPCVGNSLVEAEFSCGFECEWLSFFLFRPFFRVYAMSKGQELLGSTYLYFHHFSLFLSSFTDIEPSYPGRIRAENASTRGYTRYPVSEAENSREKT